MNYIYPQTQQQNNYQYSNIPSQYNGMGYSLNNSEVFYNNQSNMQPSLNNGIAPLLLGAVAGGLFGYLAMNSSTDSQTSNQLTKQEYTTNTTTCKPQTCTQSNSTTTVTTSKTQPKSKLITSSSPKTYQKSNQLTSSLKNIITFKKKPQTKLPKPKTNQTLHKSNIPASGSKDVIISKKKESQNQAKLVLSPILLDDSPPLINQTIQTTNANQLKPSLTDNLQFTQQVYKEQGTCLEYCTFNNAEEVEKLTIQANTWTNNGNLQMTDHKGNSVIATSLFDVMNYSGMTLQDFILANHGIFSIDDSDGNYNSLDLTELYKPNNLKPIIRLNLYKPAYAKAVAQNYERSNQQYIGTGNTAQERAMNALYEFYNAEIKDHPDSKYQSIKKYLESNNNDTNQLINALYDKNKKLFRDRGNNNKPMIIPGDGIVIKV